MAEPKEHLCKNEGCRAPINEACRCEICRTLNEPERRHKIYCHVCTQMYVTVANSSHLQREQAKWQKERDERRKNMGL